MPSSTSLALVPAASARWDWCMTPGELAAVRRRLEEFAAEMLASLARRDQRDKGATYVRGLLLDGRRKSMQPMAERLGVDEQGLQQFVSSSTWAVEPVRERLARRAVEVIAPDAWVIDDTGFFKDGTASPGVARQYSGTLGKVGNCQIGVSICAVTDAASCPLDWRLFLPERWDDAGVAGPEAAAAAPARRGRAGTPPGGAGRHPGRGAAQGEVAAGAGHDRRAGRLGAGTAGGGRRCRLRRHRRVPGRAQRPRPGLGGAGAGGAQRARRGRGARGGADLRAGKAVPAALPHQTGRPARARAGRRPRRGPAGHLAAGLPRAHALPLRGAAGPTGRAPPGRPAGRRRLTAGGVAAGRMVTGGRRAHRLLALVAARRHTPGRAGPAGQDPLADRARLPRAEDRPRPGPLRGPHLRWLAPARHPGHRRPVVPHRAADQPKSGCAGLSLYAVLHELQALLATWTGTCSVCGQRIDSHARAPT